VRVSELLGKHLGMFTEQHELKIPGPLVIVRNGNGEEVPDG
jgi:hypothetical protein